MGKGEIKEALLFFPCGKDVIRHEEFWRLAMVREIVVVTETGILKLLRDLDRFGWPRVGNRHG